MLKLPEIVLVRILMTATVSLSGKKATNGGKDEQLAKRLNM
jgi:hypothetical protein